MTPLLTSAILRTQSDGRLVTLARAGNDRAFEAIVDRYSRPLHRHCRKLLPESRCDDAVQQTFVNAWSALQEDVAVRDLRAWLYRIARNVALNTLGRSGYDYAELHESLRSAPSTEEDAERREVIRSTLEGVAGLPERQREALLAVAVQGRTHDDVAAELGIGDGALRQLLHRARTSLRTAATAVTPMPLIGWAAAGEHALTAARVGEIAAGAGSAGVAGVAVKAGVVVVGAAAIAGSAAGGVHLPAGGTAAPAAHAAPAHRVAVASSPASPAPAARRAAVTIAATAITPARTHRRRKGSSFTHLAATRDLHHAGRDDGEHHGSGEDGRAPLTAGRTEDHRGPSRETEHRDGSGTTSGSGSDRSGSSGASGPEGSEGSGGSSGGSGHDGGPTHEDGGTTAPTGAPVPVESPQPTRTVTQPTSGPRQSGDGITTTDSPDDGSD